MQVPFERVINLLEAGAALVISTLTAVEQQENAKIK